MSFTSKATGTVYQPGYFLKNAEDAIRETKQINQSGATTAENGAKYVKWGLFTPRMTALPSASCTRMWTLPAAICQAAS